MRILFLGGTSFAGRFAAEAALAAGHSVVFFHRGKTNPSLFPGARHVLGERSSDAGLLRDIPADIVIDTSGYTPDAVAASARAVAANIRKYIFMSTISVYEAGSAPIDESSPTQALPEGASTSELVMELYGALKARCEQALFEILGPERVVIVRAGLMVGPYDYTGRFTYWPARVARGGEILAPVGREMLVQFIDARDVAAWINGAITQDLNGTFNVTGTPRAIDFGDVLDACCKASGSDGKFTFVPTEFLQAHDVGEWIELPLWIPESDETTGMLTIATDRARVSGLQLRPIATTAGDVLAEYRLRPDQTLRAGLAPEKEAALLAAWRSR
jgi:2'-hydroxyisoflavone reductase